MVSFFSFFLSVTAGSGLMDIPDDPHVSLWKSNVFKSAFLFFLVVVVVLALLCLMLCPHCYSKISGAAAFPAFFKVNKKCTSVSLKC